MIRILSLLIWASLSTAVFAEDASPAPSGMPAPLSSGSQILVPRGLIVVTTNRGTNSYGEQTGSKLTFTLVQDVIVNGYVVAKARMSPRASLQTRKRDVTISFHRRPQIYESQ
jgi:hypothetical protein